MMQENNSYAIIGAALYVDYHPAFALPIIVSNKNPNSALVQVIDENSNTIDHFISLLDFDKDMLVATANIPLDIGEPYHYAFIDRRGELYIGPADEIAPVLRINLNDPSTPIVTQAAIAETLSIREKAREIRGSLIYSIGASLGDRAARSYANSAVRIKLWDLLSGQARGKDAMTRVRIARPKTDAWLDEQGNVGIDISAVDVTNDLKISIEEIIARLNEEFSGTVFGAPPKKVDLSGIGLDPSSTEILLAAQRSPRQEERLAVLMRALLVHPNAGLSALRRFQDRAQFARIGTELLLGAMSDGMPDQEREFQIAKIIPKLFTASFPLSRGELLYFLAAHLSDFKHIRGSIEAALRRSNSMSVNRYRSEIERLLRT